MKNEDFLKNSQNWPLGGAPGSGGQKLYQEVISYAERVLLSKFGENWMKNEDFLKNAQKWPLGGAPGGGGQKFYQKVISYAERVLLAKFGEKRMKRKDFLKNAKNLGAGVKDFTKNSFHIPIGSFCPNLVKIG